MHTRKYIAVACAVALAAFTAKASALPDVGADIRLGVPVVAQCAATGDGLPVAGIGTFSLPDEWGYAADAIRSLLMARTGIGMDVASADSAALRIVHDTSLQSEAYILKADGGRVELRAGSMDGVNWAMSTLAQMAGATGQGLLPSGVVSDAPRFAYRGLMLDCSRHFRTLAELESVIDAMNLFKLNVLHLHLTDNQGWRLALDKYPEVAARGTFYADFPEMSGKFYTPDELRRLVAYAQARGVEIIPEVDMPGHCLALLASMPWLSCRGGEFEPFPEERPQGDRKRAWENMLCVGNEKVYEFVDDLVAQLVSIFPSRYIHLGGDEVSTARWKECPRCQALYAREHFSSLQQLQDYFTRRVGEIVRRHGRTLMGWDEINDRSAADVSDVVTVWQRDAGARVAKAVGRGMQVVLCPKDPCYFDFGYARNSTRKVYEWQPLQGLGSGNAALVRGAQACLWTEFVATKADVDRMLWPRLGALAEVLWTGGGGSFDDFSRRFEAVRAMLSRTGNAVYGEDFANTLIFDAEASRPRLKPGATIDTDMPGIRFYDKEYAFDGDESTFFATPYSDLKGEHFTVTLDKAVVTRRVGILFDRSKEFPHDAELQASADGVTFTRVAEVSPDGRLEARIGCGRKVKALRLVLRSEQKNRLSIREFYFK